MSLRLKVEFEGYFLTDPIKGGDYEVEDLDNADGFAVVSTAPAVPAFCR